MRALDRRPVSIGDERRRRRRRRRRPVRAVTRRLIGCDSATYLSGQRAGVSSPPWRHSARPSSSAPPPPPPPRPEFVTPLAVPRCRATHIHLEGWGDISPHPSAYLDTFPPRIIHLDYRLKQERQSYMLRQSSAAYVDSVPLSTGNSPSLSIQLSNPFLSVWIIPMLTQMTAY